jgi:hypothetical protein
MGSNAFTDQNQGGGERKAGAPYQIGRESWSSRFIKNQNLSTLIRLPINYKAGRNLPVGFDSRIRMR